MRFFRLHSMQRSRAILFSLLICLSSALQTLAQTDTWNGGAGNWSDGADWSAGEPTSSSNVFIDGGKSVASPVTLDVQTQCNNLNISSGDSLSFNNSTNLTINGNSISNSGKILLNSAGSLTYLFVANAATLSGSGAVTMSNNSQNAVDGNSGAVLTNKSTIQGAGQIGPHFTLANQGTVDANVSGAALLVIQETGATDTNAATMEATNGGILQLATGGSSSINNTGATIEAVGANSQVQLSGNGTTINGGTLTTSSGGSIVVPAGVGVTLNGMTNAGSFSILNNGTVNLNGTISNTGTFQLNSAGSLTSLFTPSAATLTGTGTVTMSNNSQNAVDGNGGATFINQSTIQGVGEIGPHFTLTNEGTINANVTGATLAVKQDANATDTNSAIMEATNGGILQLEATGHGSINNTGGSIEAVGSGSQVQFSGFDTLVTGGTLSTSNGGMIVQPAGGASTINGVTNAATFIIQNGSFENLIGTITNVGSITVNSTGGLTGLFLPSGNVTLTGKGRVILNGNPNSAIDGNGGLIFTNESTIQGGGTIGPHFTFSNLGTLNVTKGETLNINGPFENSGVSTLTGGTYIVAGTLEYTNASIVTDAAHITLNGTSAHIINQNAVNALTNLETVTGNGSFSVAAGQVFTTTLNSAFMNAGKVTVGKNSSLKVACNSNFNCPYTQTAGTTTVDGTLSSTDSLSGLPLPGTVQIQGGKLFGTGRIASSLISSGAVTAGDTLAKSGVLSPSTYTQNTKGSLNIQIGGTTLGTQYSQLAVANGASLSGTLNVKLINGFVPAIGDSFTIVTGTAITGTFATTNLPALSGAHFVVNYSATSVTLQVESGA